MKYSTALSLLFFGFILTIADPSVPVFLLWFSLSFLLTEWFRIRHTKAFGVVEDLQDVKDKWMPVYRMDLYYSLLSLIVVLNAFIVLPLQGSFFFQNFAFSVGHILLIVGATLYSLGLTKSVVNIAQLNRLKEGDFE